ncbi:MAG: GNAT family N-acetyltransferase [bacterium]|nr:GNAT family N-acetyltransferase [bacterium]
MAAEHPSGSGLTVALLSPNSTARDSALRMILAGDPRADDSVDRRIRILREVAGAQGMNLDLLVAAYERELLKGAALAIESPGRSAIVHLSPERRNRSRLDVSVEMLRELQEQAWSRGIVLLQSMAAPNETALEDTLSRAGFRFLAELVYADRSADAATPSMPQHHPFTFVSYSPDRHDAFLQALESTYANSQDCPGLAGIRSTEDVLDGHRATGLFDPDLWFLARHDGAPAGVLLLAPLHSRPAVEVAYMGVSAEYRRQGIADALLNHGTRQIDARGFSGLTLAVDSTNDPARRLYRKWGFVETERRRAWIATRPS